MCTYFWLWRMVMSWWLKIEISVCVLVILSKCFFSNNFSLPVISIRIGTQIDYTWINLSICFSFPQTTSMLQSLLKLESSVIPPPKYCTSYSLVSEAWYTVDYTHGWIPSGDLVFYSSWVKDRIAHGIIPRYIFIL